MVFTNFQGRFGWFICFVLVSICWSGLSCKSESGPEKKQPLGSPVNEGMFEPELYQIPVGNSPVFGAKEAKVTIIEFSEFKCPYCMMINKPLKEAVEAYPNEARLVFKNFLIHPQTAKIPAEAALAANEQGKFWEMADLLFAQMKSPVDSAKAIEFAKQLGLNEEKFKTALSSNIPEKQLQADMELGMRIGVRGTPSLYINGKPYKGERTAEGLKKAIAAEIQVANQLVQKGVAVKDLYVELTKKGKLESPQGKQMMEQMARRKKEMAAIVWKVEPGTSPATGPQDAPITLIAFVSYECPQSKKFNETIAQLNALYKDKLRVVVKHFVRPRDKKALLAHEAAVFAAQNGKFWEWHKALFESGKFEQTDLLTLAKKVGLDEKQLEKALKERKFRAIVDADTVAGMFTPTRKTPGIFINGLLVEEPDLETIKKVIGKELAHTTELLKKGVAPAKLYAEIMKKSRDSRQQLIKELPQDVDAGDSPRKGDKTAPITITIFSDFQCSYCRLAGEIIDKLMKAKEFKDKVSVVYKANPLQFHKEAPLAAEAAFAAHAQGKFWEMYDLLFKNMSKLGADQLKAYAEKAGLDMAQYNKAMTAHEFKKNVDRDLELVKKLEIKGAPGIAIGRQLFQGAVPLVVLKHFVREALNK